MMHLALYLLVGAIAMALGSVIGGAINRAIDRGGRCNWCGRGEK